MALPGGAPWNGRLLSRVREFFFEAEGNELCACSSFSARGRVWEGFQPSVACLLITLESSLINEAGSATGFDSIQDTPEHKLQSEDSSHWITDKGSGGFTSMVGVQARFVRAG